MLTFEKMRPEERDTCAALAARAFEDYEYFTYYIPNEQRRTRFLSTMLEIEVRINDGPADFFTAKEDRKILAVAMLCPPEYKKPSDMAYMRAGFGKCFLQGGIRDVAAWNAMEGKAGQPCHSLGGQTYIPAVFIMQTLLGITGLVWAQPVADVLSLVLVAVLYIFTMRKMKAKMNPTTD